MNVSELDDIITLFDRLIKASYPELRYHFDKTKRKCADVRCKCRITVICYLRLHDYKSTYSILVTTILHLITY